MINLFNITLSHTRFVFVLLFCLVVTSTSCSLKKIKEQTEKADSGGYIEGSVKRLSDQKGPVVVLRFRNEKGIPVREKATMASSDGHFKFAVLPGEYYIAAFIDRNNDGQYQKGEHGNYHGTPSVIDVVHGKTATLRTIVISGDPPLTGMEGKAVDKTIAAWKNLGQVVTLDDPRFTQDYYNMGLWEPFNFLDQAEGGLFFLEKYKKEKVPVLFVHGVMGGPTNWAEVIKSMDTRNFQPWLLYYPSGLRLDVIADNVVEAVSRLHAKYKFERFFVIAHSMGGLVTRSFVKKYVAYSPENSKLLRLVMTINSPMDGMPAAASGVEHSPIIVPSWRDVAPGSEFIKDLQEWEWPSVIPYHLVVSYNDGESGDGVVPLQSQSLLKLQAESTRMYIFNNTHVGTLSDSNFLSVFNKILSGAAGN